MQKTLDEQCKQIQQLQDEVNREQSLRSQIRNLENDKRATENESRNAREAQSRMQKTLDEQCKQIQQLRDAASNARQMLLKAGDEAKRHLCVEQRMQLQISNLENEKRAESQNAREAQSRIQMALDEQYGVIQQLETKLLEAHQETQRHMDHNNHLEEKLLQLDGNLITVISAKNNRLRRHALDNQNRYVRKA